MNHRSNKCIAERRVILTAIARDALRFMSETLNDLGWTEIEVSQFGLTAQLNIRGQHVIVVTCLPCDPTNTELLITISSVNGAPIEEQVLESINVLNELTE
ncbi:MAG TPA: hypothetical protein V6C89_15125 [Drouetiella sp.]